jgi:hypothetical protein
VSEPSAAVSLPRRCLAILRLLLGVLLGLFVLAQAGFLFVYNVADYSGRARLQLENHRAAWRKREKGEQPGPREGNPTIWTAVTNLPFRAGPLFEEWVEKGQHSRLARFKKQLDGPLDRWARLSGQEQGWSLFAPDTVDWTCLVYVELKWTEDAGPCESVILLSDNHPRDIGSYFRFGHFRLRRFESKLETPLRKNSPDEKEEDYLFRWQERVKEKVLGDTDRPVNKEIAIYLNWKLRKFLEKNPDMPAPAEVILHSRTWTIPPPPGPRPWQWQEESDQPVCRWRPPLHWPNSEGLELYLHSKGEFENKNPTRWPLIPHPAKPRSSD